MIELIEKYELLIGFMLAIIGIYVKDAVTKNSVNHRLGEVEKNLTELTKTHREDMKEMNSTMQKTLQQFASMDATLQGLTGWLKKVDGDLRKKL